jgi:hypothetical protein
MAEPTTPNDRAIWVARLERRLDNTDAETRRLSHELVAVLAHFGDFAELDGSERERELERVLAGLGERAGIGPPPR